MHLDSLNATDVEARPTNAPLPVVGWCVDARQDPITGLVAFPDFNFFLPDILAFCTSNGYDLGIAIGDVDNLKDYVENSKRMDPSAYGHLAGCALMQTLGLVAACWFHGISPTFGCVSTFGGDEIIVALAVDRGADARFEALVVELRNELLDSLPRSVSFGWTVAHLDNAGSEPTDRQHHRRRCTTLLSAVDMALLRQKTALRDAGLPSKGFVTKAPAHG
jgi:GGDEF domain-containing protein